MEASAELIKLREWLGCIGIIGLSFVAVGIARALLRRVSSRKGLQPLVTLWPSIAGLIVLFGFRIAVQAAPISERPEQLLDNVIYVLATLITLGLARRAALISVEWSAARTRPSQTLQQGFLPMLRNLITLIAFLVAAIMILQHFHYDVMSLITALGVGSLAVGLAAKDTLSNMISGFTLIIDNNLRPGDRVNLGGTVGDVEEIGLRSTRVKLGDGNTLIVPNNDLVNNKILNLSMPSLEVTASTNFRVPYSAQFARVREVCLAIIEGLAKGNPRRKGWVNLVSLADGSQLVQAGFWLSHPDDGGAALTEFHEKLIPRLEEAGIRLVTADAAIRALLPPTPKP